MIVARSAMIVARSAMIVARSAMIVARSAMIVARSAMIVARSAIVGGSFSSRQQRRWDIVWSSPQSHFVDCVTTM